MMASLALAALLTSCEDTAPPIGPTPEAWQLSHSPGDGLKGTIAFSSDRDGDREIFVMNADGSGVTQLTNNAGSDNRPDWTSR